MLVGRNWSGQLLHPNPNPFSTEWSSSLGLRQVDRAKGRITVSADLNHPESATGSDRVYALGSRV